MTRYDVADVARVLGGRLYRWVMWSPIRLAVVVIVVVAIAVGWATLATDQGIGGGDERMLESTDLPAGWEEWPVVDVESEDDATQNLEPADPTTASTADSEESEESEESEGAEESDHSDHEARPTAKDQAAAGSVARKFAKTYIDTEWSKQAKKKAKKNAKQARKIAKTQATKWRHALKPLVIDGLYKKLATVDPRNIEITKIKSVDLGLLGAQGGVATVETNDTKMALKLTNLGDRWVVSQIQFPPNKG